MERRRKIRDKWYKILDTMLLSIGFEEEYIIAKDGLKNDGVPRVPDTPNHGVLSLPTTIALARVIGALKQDAERGSTTTASG